MTKRPNAQTPKRPNAQTPKRPTAKPLPARPQLPVATVADLESEYYTLAGVIRALFTGKQTDDTRKALVEHRARADRMWKTLQAARAAKQ